MNVFAARSPKERLWMLIGLAAAFLLVVIGWFLVIGPQRSHTDSINASSAQVETENSALQAHIATLQAQEKNLSSYQAKLAAARKALPDSSGLPDFLRTLQSLGTKTHTDAVNVTVGAPTDVTAVANGVPSVVPTDTTTGTTSTTTPAPAPTPTTSATAPSSGGVFGLTINAQVNGSADSLNAFLEQLQAVQPRAVLITSITESSGADSGTGQPSSTSGMNLQLTMQAFVAPSSSDESAQLAAATG